MLAIGRALMSRPGLLMLDEPSLGLAPIVIEQLFDKIRDLNQRTSLGVLLSEQHSAMALGIAGRALVLETGTITLSGPAAVLADDPRIREAYLGGDRLCDDRELLSSLRLRSIAKSPPPPTPPRPRSSEARSPGGGERVAPVAGGGDR